MNGRKIFTIGETLLDIIFKNHQAIASKPGGAMFNSSISLGRLGLPVHFISEYAMDQTGNLIDDFLHTNFVSTEYVYRYNNGKTALALAFLDENNNASYSFYKFYPENRLVIKEPEIQKDDIVFFGSFYAITPQIRGALVKILKKAIHNKAIILYDPNFRKTHLNELDKILPYILENITISNIIRGSNEDFENLFRAKNSTEAYNHIQNSSKILLYTSNSKGVFLHTKEYHKKYSVKSITPVSTIGAGDSFNAGVIYGIIKNQIMYTDIASCNPEIWDDIIITAIDFATEVCLHMDNYISKDFAEKYILNKNITTNI